MEQFLKSLRHRKAKVQIKIDAESARPAPDTLRLHGLKKLRLRFREQIEHIEQQLRRSSLPSMNTRR